MAHYILALETSGKAGSVALAEFDADCPKILPHRLLATELLDPNYGSAKTLAPAIDRLLRTTHTEPKQICAIALASGPGSFTGLRVGVATAKAMAYALKIPLIELDTLDVIAAQITTAFPEIHILMDAYRGQVFHAEYSIDPSAVPSTRAKHSTRIIDISDWLIEVSRSTNVTLGGPGCDRVRRYLKEAAAEPTSFSDHRASEAWTWLDGPSTYPNADTIARLARQKLQDNETTDAFVIKPRYFRSSAAEEKLEKKNQ